MNKSLVVSVDEGTKQFMEYIDEGIRNSISYELKEAVRDTDENAKEIFNSQQQIMNFVKKSNNGIDKLVNNLESILPALTGINDLVAKEASNLSQVLLSHTEKLNAAQIKENEKSISSVKKDLNQKTTAVLEELSALSEQFISFKKNTEEVLTIIAKQQESLLSKSDAIEKTAVQLMKNIKENTETAKAQYDEIADRQQLLIDMIRVIQEQNEYLRRPFYKKLFGRNDRND